MKYKCIMCGTVFDNDNINTYDKGTCCYYDKPFYIRTPKSKECCEHCIEENNDICNVYVDIDQPEDEPFGFLCCPECGSFIIEKIREKVTPSAKESLEKISKEQGEFDSRVEKAIAICKRHIGDEEFNRLSNMMEYRFRVLLDLEKDDPEIDRKFPTAKEIIEQALRNTNDRVLLKLNNFGFETEYNLYIAMMSVLHTIEEDSYITYKKDKDNGLWTTYHVDFKTKDAKKMN